MSGVLNPCPFCGGNGLVAYIRDGRKIVCAQCGAAGPPEFHGPDGLTDTIEQAITSWNRRARPEGDEI